MARREGPFKCGQRRRAAPRVQALKNVKQDFRRYWEITGRRGFGSSLRVFLVPSFKAVAAYRFASWTRSLPLLFRLLLKPFAWIFQWYVRAFLGIQISPAATIGSGLYIGHFGGIVISGRAQIGENVSLSQGVTIGVSLNDGGAPTIGDSVYIGPGAVIFGNLRVGDGAKIGANAVIHKSIPAGATAVAWPGFKILEEA